MAKKGQKFNKYDFDLKEALIKDYLKGFNTHELKAKYEIINITQVKKWLRIYREEGIDGLKPKQRGRIPKTVEQTELEQLRMENEILKKIQDLLEQEKP